MGGISAFPGRLRRAWQTERLPKLLLPAPGPYPLLIGRDPANGLRLNHETVSRLHAELSAQNGRWVLRDLGSTNGTCVNGQRLVGSIPVRDGDQVSFGRMSFRLTAPALRPPELPPPRAPAVRPSARTAAVARPRSRPPARLSPPAGAAGAVRARPAPPPHFHQPAPAVHHAVGDGRRATGDGRRATTVAMASAVSGRAVTATSRPASCSAPRPRGRIRALRPAALSPERPHADCGGPPTVVR